MLFVLCIRQASAHRSAHRSLPITVGMTDKEGEEEGRGWGKHRNKGQPKKPINHYYISFVTNTTIMKPVV